MLALQNIRIGHLKKGEIAESSTYVHNRVISEQRTTKQSVVRLRSVRAQYRLDTKKTLQNLASVIGESELADRVCRCHSKLSVLTCGQHIARVIPNFSCEFRLCPDCGRRRSAKLLRKYLPAVVAFPSVSNTQAVHLVLTQIHKPETLQASVARITRNFKTLRKRKFWKGHFKGGLFAVEFTIDASGLYHTHLHILGFRSRFFDVKALKDLWYEITGDSTNLRLDRIEGQLIDGLREVLKYAVKPACISDFTPDHLRDFLRMKNQRMFQTFGEFQTFARTYEPLSEDVSSLLTGLDTSDLHEGSPCPHQGCNDVLFDVRINGRDLPAFYRGLEYSKHLTRKHKPPKT